MAIRSPLSCHVVQHTVTSDEATATTCDISVGEAAYRAKAILAVKTSSAGVVEVGGTVTAAYTGVVTVANVATLFTLVAADVITLLIVE